MAYTLEFTPNSLVKMHLGTVNQNLNIVIDADMEIVRGCSTIFMGQMWYFGGGRVQGSEAQKQVS